MIPLTGFVNRRQTGDRIWFCFLLALFFTACLLSGLWGNTGSGTFSIAGIVFTGGRFITLYSALWLAMLCLFFYFPFQSFNLKNTVLIVATALIARLLIFFQLPSDDVYRYLWEGSLFAEGVNPYLFPPNDAGLAGLAQDFPFHSLINHPDISAAYPPLMILFFSVVSRVSLSLYGVKAVMLVFDLAGILFLISILKKRKITIRWSLLYALNPLVLYSFAGEGHLDALQNFFLLGAVFFYDRKKWPLLFLFAGFAVQVKYVAIIAVPFFINRDNYKVSPLLLFPVILPFIPFLSEHPAAVFSGIRQFESQFAFNGSVHSLLRVISGEIGTATMICRCLFIGVMVYGILKFSHLLKGKNRFAGEDPSRGILFAFGALILLSPTIHFWYLTWILPFAVIRNQTSWLVLSLTAGVYFSAKSAAWFGGLWALPVWAQILEWLPFYLFLAFELYYVLKREEPVYFKAPESVSVIIPVLNEENKIAACIRSINCDPSVSEIIVVDGGSEDGTVDIAEAAGVRVLINQQPIDGGGGRGGQILSGIKAAAGDIAVIVHSDVMIHSNLFTQMKEFMKLTPDVSGGAIGTQFDSPSLKTRCVEFLNGLRVVFFGISFGDQIQFFRRQAVLENHLFPDIPLMEDVEFSLRLPKAGRRVFMFGDATVSPRRWEEKGASNFFTVLHLFFVYLLQRIFKMPDVVTMYRNYYR